MSVHSLKNRVKNTVYTVFALCRDYVFLIFEKNTEPLYFCKNTVCTYYVQTLYIVKLAVYTPCTNNFPVFRKISQTMYTPKNRRNTDSVQGLYRENHRKPFNTLSSHCYKLCIHSVHGMYMVYAVNFCLFWTCFCPFRYVQGLYFGGLLCVHCVYTLCTVSVGGHLCRNYPK